MLSRRAGAGSAILLNEQDQRIYEVDLGVMDSESMRPSADSLQHLLEFGASLTDQGEW